MAEKKVALFAGIGRLGVPVVQNLVEKGWRCTVSYRSGFRSEETVSELIKQFGTNSVYGFNLDITDPALAERFVDFSRGVYRRVDALINIASYYPSEEDDWQRWASGSEVTSADWDFYLSNFFPARFVSQAIINKWNSQHPDKSADELNIINFADAYQFHHVFDSSVNPYECLGKSILDVSLEEVKSLGFSQLQQNGTGPRECNPYVLAKRDIVYLTRSLALASQGCDIRVNAIAPGPMLPPPDQSEQSTQHHIDATVLKHWGGTEPIVQAVDYLLNNKFVTGEVLKVDGGMGLYRIANS